MMRVSTRGNYGLPAALSAAANRRLGWARTLRAVRCRSRMAHATTYSVIAQHCTQRCNMQHNLHSIAHHISAMCPTTAAHLTLHGAPVTCTSPRGRYSIHASTCTRTHVMDAHARASTHSGSLAHAHALTCKCVCTNAKTWTRAHKVTRSHTHARTHAHTHAGTHARSRA